MVQVDPLETHVPAPNVPEGFSQQPPLEHDSPLQQLCPVPPQAPHCPAAVHTVPAPEQPSPCWTHVSFVGSQHPLFEQAAPVVQHDWPAKPQELVELVKYFAQGPAAASA